MAALTDFITAYRQSRSVSSACQASGYQIFENYPQAGFYVYALIDPRDDSIFYIGKGIGGRVLKHEERTRRGVIQNREKVKRIQEIYASGQEVLRRILFVTDSEEVALSVEDDVIHQMADMGLTNILSGTSTTHPAVRKIASDMREKLAAFRAALAAS